MPIIAQATIRAQPGKRPLLVETLEKFVIPCMEAEGWKLLGCFLQRTGTINTVIDLWELEDMNHYMRGTAAMAAHPQIAEIRARLDASVQKETIVFAERLR